jgi:hypothetical protein
VPIFRHGSKSRQLRADLTLTLHKFLSTVIADMLGTVAISEQMLDARYLMLDIQ